MNPLSRIAGVAVDRALGLPSAAVPYVVRPDIAVPMPDGVALLGCRSGPDYQCHFIQGSQLLGTRMDNVRETLGRLALEPERVQVIETSIVDARRLPVVLEAFAEEIRALGPNPMKGF